MARFDGGECQKKYPTWRSRYQTESRIWRELSATLDQTKSKSKTPSRENASSSDTTSPTKRNGLKSPKRTCNSDLFGSLERARSTRGRAHPSLFLAKGTIDTSSTSESTPEQSYYRPTGAAMTDTAASSSMCDLLNQLSGLKPVACPSIRSKQSRILASRKSYAGLSSKTAWQTHMDGTAYASTDIFGPAPDLRLSIVNIPPGIPENAKVPTTVCARKSRSRYPSSWGRSAGNPFKKSRASSPILTTEEGRGSAMSAERRQTVSWGRRAAAAAFGIGQRLKERERNEESSSSSSDDLSSAWGAGTGEGPIIATPQCATEHPRPTRVLNLDRFVTLCREKRETGEGSG